MNVNEFLRAIWDLPGFYVIGVRHGDSWQWFTADNPEFAELILERFKDSADIYYGVNPRHKEPENGKGSDSDIKEANTFFADLDFKEKKQCTPGIYKDDPETHELELCYEENGKTVYVHRPPLKEVLEKIEKAGLPAPTFIIDSGNGYQLLWKSKTTFSAHDWKKLEEEFIKKLQEAGLPVDPQVKDLSRVLRLPGSINQRSKREAKIIYVGDKISILPEKYERIVQAVLPCFKKAEDRRFELVGHLSGFLVRRGIPLQDAETIVETLYERAGLPHAEHVRDVKYTYKDFEEGKPVTGFPELQSLCEELGAPINVKLLEREKKKKKKGKKKEKEEEQQTLTEEKPIQSFDILRIYHDFQHGKAYVATWKAVKQRRVEDGIEYWVNVVKIDKVYVNENGNIHALTDEEYEKLKEEYLDIININVKPKEFLELNLPTEIKTDVKISDVYKKVLVFIKERITFKWEEDYVAVTVWVLSSYFLRLFIAFPYLAPLKSGYNSGGTELLWTLSKIMPRPKIFNDPTPASIYTSAELKDVSQLFDEFRENISRDRLEEIKNILRVGYRRDGIIPRVEITKGGRETRDFNAYSPRVVIDQSLITSEYDIASRCLFVWLVRDPNRKSNLSVERPKDLINELYSVFLKYAPQTYTLYNNIETGLTGRYDQLFRPLLTIAQIIDAEDSSLKVTEQLMKALERSIEFSESIALEGDPQKKIISLVVDYIRSSIGLYIEGKISTIPSPWHIYEDGEGEVYIFISDLRKEITERAVEVYQKDISYRYDQEGKSAVAEREWERLDPEIQEFMKDRKFVALLKKFFPENVRRHRDRNAFFLKFDDYSNIISLKYIFDPSRVAGGGEYTPRINQNQGIRISNLSCENNSNPSKTPQYTPPGDSNSDFGIKIQMTSENKENTISETGLKQEIPFNSPLRSTENNPKSELIQATQIRLDSDFGIISQSRNFYKAGAEKNNPTQAVTAEEQKIYALLYKILWHPDAYMPLKKLTKDELKLLPKLKEMGLVNFDNEAVWLTPDGGYFIQEMEKKMRKK